MNVCQQEKNRETEAAKCERALTRVARCVSELAGLRVLREVFVHRDEAEVGRD